MCIWRHFIIDMLYRSFAVSERNNQLAVVTEFSSKLAWLIAGPPRKARARLRRDNLNSDQTLAWCQHPFYLGRLHRLLPTTTTSTTTAHHYPGRSRCNWGYFTPQILTQSSLHALSSWASHRRSHFVPSLLVQLQVICALFLTYMHLLLGNFFIWNQKKFICKTFEM